MPIEETEKVLVQISLKEWRNEHKYRALKSVVNYCLALSKDSILAQEYKKEKSWRLSKQEQETIARFKSLSMLLERRQFIYDRYATIDKIEEIVPDIERIIGRMLRGTPIMKQFDTARLQQFDPETAQGLSW